MSFISSGNLSTPTVFPLGSLNPEVGTILTEAIGLNKKQMRESHGSSVENSLPYTNKTTQYITCRTHKTMSMVHP